MARPIKILSHRIVTSPSEVPEIYTRVGFRLENEHPPRTPELAPRDRLGSERPVPRPARTPRSSCGRSRRCPCAENHRTEGMGRATPPRPASGRPVGDPRQLRLRVVPPEVRRDELAAARPRRPGPHKKTPRVAKAVSLFLRRFSGPSGDLGGRGSEVCFTGNALRMLARFGYRKDPRTGAAIDWLVRHQKKDGGGHCFPSPPRALGCRVA